MRKVYCYGDSNLEVSLSFLGWSSERSKDKGLLSESHLTLIHLHPTEISDVVLP